MASYRLNREALEDLDRLYEHGVLTFGLRQADAYFDGIVNRFQKIADQPELYPAIDHIRQGYRRSAYKSHSIYSCSAKTQSLLSSCFPVIETEHTAQPFAAMNWRIS